MSVANLNTARKAKARSDAKAQADENAARHGLTKAERLLYAAQADHASTRLSQLKFEEDE